MAIISLQIESSNLENPFTTDSSEFVAPLQKFVTEIRRAMIGARKNAYTLTAKSGLVAASGTITLATSSGDIAAIINGVTITVTYATSDTNTATLLKNAINASSNALVANHVTATSAAGVVTITAATPGITGNTITLATTGTGSTASGARLTGGTTTKVAYSF
jgi:phage tail sheath gpL-like